MLQVVFKIALIAGSVNAATDFLTRLKLRVTGRISPKIREDVQTTLIEVTTSSSYVANEEKFFFLQADAEDATEAETPKRKEQSREKATEWGATDEPSSMKPSISEFRNID